MGRDEHTGSLDAYLPRLLGAVLGDAPQAPVESRTLRGHGVALIADLSGFTALSERLCARGPDGIEALSRLLNDTFGRMVDCIAGHGGDTVRFAGDAPIAVWWGDDAADVTRQVAAAAACGRALHSGLDVGSGLSLRVGVGAGTLLATTVGGVEDRWELVVSGGALTAMTAALRQCERGEVVVPSEGDHEVLREVAPPSLAPAPRRSLPDSVQRAFVPRALLRRLDAGQANWLAEMRQVSVLFGCLTGVDGEDPEAIGVAHAAFRGLQAAVYRRGGGINQFLLDDKGLTLVAAWGLPGTTHEDDARRALGTALEASTSMRQLGLELRAGVATGRAYSGTRGNERRREYAMVGDTVNLAARLMMASDGPVLCDAATSRRAALAPSAERQLDLKGRGAPVHAFVYQSVAGSTAAPSPSPGPIIDRGEIIGRESERHTIGNLFEQSRRGVGGVLWIEGEAGIGKSTLVAAAVLQGRGEGLAPHVCAGDAIGRAESYLVWRGLLVQVFEAADARALVDALGQRFANDREIIERMPLLGPVLGLDLGETALTRQLGGDVRTDSIREQVIQILTPLASQRPLIFVFDDGHWMDSASWALLRAVVRRLPQVLVVVGSRPLGADASVDALWLRERATARVALEGLSIADITLLASRRVGARTLAPEVERFVTTRAGGHPLFACELVASMMDAGVVAVTAGVCHAQSASASLDEHAFPDSVQGIIRMRIDHLETGQQLTLKLASVIGAVFDFTLLCDICALPDRERALRAQLAGLEALRFVTVEAPEPALAYRFHHALIRDVAYSLMLGEQRREVHTDVACRIEAGAGDHPPWAILAHHWTKTHNDHRSLECLERAGAESNEAGASREADRFYGEALALAERSETVVVDAHRLAAWDNGRTTAWTALGDFSRGRLHAERGLTRIGRPMPRLAAGWLQRLVVELFGVAATPLRRGWGTRPHPQTEHVQLVTLLGKLSQIAFYQRDYTPMVVAGLAAVNAAERHAARAVAADAYVMLATVAAYLGLARMAERWWRRAAEAPDSAVLTAVPISRAYDAINRGHWEAVDTLLAEAGALARRLGHRLHVEEVLMLAAFRHTYASSPRAGEAAGQALLAQMRLRECPQRELWGHLVVVGNRLERGDIAGALAQLTSCESLVADGDPGTRQSYHAMLAECHWRLHDRPLAIVHVETVQQSILDNPDLGIGNHTADGPLVVVSLGLADDPDQRRQHLARARWSLDRLHKAGRAVVSTRVLARRLEGDYWYARGKTRTAMKWWSRALAGAEAAALPLERALAHHALGRVRHDRSTIHASAARSLFEALDISRRASAPTEMERP